MSMCVNVQPFLNECIGTAQTIFMKYCSNTIAYEKNILHKYLQKIQHSRIVTMVNQSINLQLLQVNTSNESIPWKKKTKTPQKLRKSRASASRHNCLGRNNGELSTEVDWVDIVDAEGEGVSDHVSGVETPGVKRCSMWPAGPAVFFVVAVFFGEKLRPFRPFSFNSLRMHSNKAWSWCSKDAMTQRLRTRNGGAALVSTLKMLLFFSHVASGNAADVAQKNDRDQNVEFYHTNKDE